MNCNVCGIFLGYLGTDMAVKTHKKHMLKEHPDFVKVSIYFRNKGHFFSDHSTLTNRPDAKMQLSLIFLKIWAFKG